MKATQTPTIALSILILFFPLSGARATLGSALDKIKTTEQGLEKVGPENTETHPAKQGAEPKAQAPKPSESKNPAAGKQPAEASEDEKEAAEGKLVSEKIIKALASCTSLTEKIKTLEKMKVTEHSAKLNKDCVVRISFGTDKIDDGGLCSHIDVEEVNEKAQTTDLLCCIVVTFEKSGNTHIKLKTTLEEEQQAIEIRLTKTPNRADIVAACPRVIRHKMTVPRLVTVLSDELQYADDSLGNIVKGEHENAKKGKTDDIPDQPQHEEDQDQSEPKKELLKKERYRKPLPRKSDPNKTA